jgi:hypothetical protein
MKTKYLLPLLFYFLPILIAQAQESGKLIEHTLMRTFTAEQLAAHFKAMRIPKVFFGTKHDVNVYDVVYTSTYADGSIVKATGMVFAPIAENIDVPLQIYNQGTQLCKERVLNYRGEQAMCLAYASDGYLVLMPDYIGMGRGDRSHLYMHAKTEADAAVDMLKVVSDSLQLFGVQSFGKLFISGYSQGGHATLATHRMLQNNYADRFPVTASAPMSGPYNIFFAVYDGRNKFYTQPGYMPYLLKGYYESIGHPERISEAFQQPYASIIPKLLSGDFPMDELNKELPDTAFLSVRREFFEEFENNPEHPFRKYLEENNVHDWKPEAPVMLCYCKGDEQVNYQNSILTYEAMKRNGATNVELWRAGKKFGHLNCALFSMVYTKMYFDGYVKNRPGSHGPHFKRMLLNIGKAGVKAF